ncbi:HEAT repeat domain-containing protein [Denitrobaculum tricleocarpae]|nr:HEAT repeat domain-containing protein [Denitrobaculum tricleocarpae]
MIAENLPPKVSSAAVEIILRRLKAEDEVVRCAAARALAALGDAAAAPHLVEALLDEDPDVRTDAMYALVRCARPEDADALRRSLLGDPVKEVKILAIEALAAVKDAASLPLLMALSKDRCDHDVAWEDEAGMWDDWLDVQLAAIAALGEMAAQEAVQDMLLARDDEMGQELDDVVFAALAKIPESGITTLLSLLRDSNPRVREQALIALSKANSDVLITQVELLVQDSSPQVRRLALSCLDSESSWVGRLLRDDPSDLVRQALVETFAETRRDIALMALEDRSEGVRSAALEVVLSRPEFQISEDLAANMQAWMMMSGQTLAATCAKFLPRACGTAAHAPLCEVVCDPERALEVRIAALRALKDLPLDAVIAVLKTCVSDPTRQIRASALSSLATLSKAEDDAVAQSARAALVGAISGQFATEEAAKPVRAESEESPVEASKVEDIASHRVTISQDGDILSEDEVQARKARGEAIECDPAQEKPEDRESAGDRERAEDGESNVIDVTFPKSTLAAIQTISTDAGDRIVSPRSGDAPQASSKKGGKGKRRVPVDGPDSFAMDLRLVALRVSADCHGEDLEQAFCDAAEATDLTLRIAAYATLVQRSEVLPLSESLLPALIKGLGDENPLIRGYAAQAIGKCLPHGEKELEALLDDADALVRATALRAIASLPGERVLLALRDDSSFVRQAAMERVLAGGSPKELTQSIAILLEEGFSSNLAEVCRQSAEAQKYLITALAAEDLARKPTLAGLEAIASA